MATPQTRTQSFTDQLKLVLESSQDPAAIGHTSPLAAPYFLGNALHGIEPTPRSRGQALCDEITRAVESLWGGPLSPTGADMLDAAQSENDATGARYACLILELNYFKTRFRPAPRTQAEIYHDILHVSRPTHDRHLRAAVERLAAQLLQRLRPAVRAEQPIAPPTLVGRDSLLAEIAAQLRQGRSVSLTGPGGVGKTSLGAAVVDGWDSPAVFWYTLRPTLNDQAESLIFALGHFLHTQGASTLWRQLIADGGHIKDAGLALGLAISDLESLPCAPLLCFDEMDFLRPLTLDQPNLQHTQILEFLESLHSHTALLYMGQRAFWPSDDHHHLEGWALAQLAEWLTTQGIDYTPADLEGLYDYTGGNPRLAELCIAYFQTGVDTSIAAVLEHLPRFQALLPLWLRLERRLPAAERRILELLSVFRSAAPADVWLAPDMPARMNGGEPDTETQTAIQTVHDAFQQLLARRLVRLDGLGGVTLLPALREVVYGELPVERQEALHSAAAEIRAVRGEYTAAAYHLVRAGQPEAAVQLWYPHRADEIVRGEAGSATAIFSQISQRRLSTRRAKELALLRSELYTLLGESARVVDELSDIDWPADDIATPQAKLRLGQAQESQGQADRALELYGAGLDAVNNLLGQSAQLHVQRSYTYLRRREMDTAWREANLARFHAETMLGVVQDQRGDYATARAHYLCALDLAQSMNYAPGIAQTYHYLAMLHGRRLEMADALPYFEQSMQFYGQIGDRVQTEYVRGNLASAYIQARQFDLAVEPAQRALRFFQAMGNPFRFAQNASNLAEAHAELGNLAEAEHFAELVLNQEEPQSHPYALYTLGTVYKQRREWTRALAHYDQSRQMAEANDDTYLLAFAWRALGEVHAAAAAPDQARPPLDLALELFQRLNIDEEVRATRAILAEVSDSRPESTTQGVP
ncbi:MAG: tetratricopeptide repeat protein [Litorilinea sp.]